MRHPSYYCCYYYYSRGDDKALVIRAPCWWERVESGAMEKSEKKGKKYEKRKKNE
jgi:hypothetical protein